MKDACNYKEKCVFCTFSKGMVILKINRFLKIQCTQVFFGGVLTKIINGFIFFPLGEYGNICKKI